MGSSAWAEEWVFLPPSALFQTLIGDPREPYTGITAYLNQTRYEGAVGETFDFLRYSPPTRPNGDGVFSGKGTSCWMRMAPLSPCGRATGTPECISRRHPALFPPPGIRAPKRPLGDSLQEVQAPIFFSRENFNLTSSFQPFNELRLYARIGDWENIYPRGNDPFFCSAGTEIYSLPTDFAGTYLRAYFTADFQWKGETQSLNKNFELGVQWKFKKEESRDVRLALLYYNGLSDFGQFYQNPDEHWGIGLYFDP